MKRRIMLTMSLLLCSAMLFGCGGNTDSAADPAGNTASQAELPEFTDPEGTKGYTMMAYHFSISKTFEEFEGASYNHVFREKGADEEDASYIGIMELANLHMTAEAFSQAIEQDFTAQGYENVQGSTMEIGGAEAYHITCTGAEGEDITTDYTAVCSGDGSLFLVFAAYSDAAAEAYTAEVDRMLNDLVFFGEENKDGGKFESAQFSVSYSGDWASLVEDENSFTLEYRLAESECQFMTNVKITAVEDGGTADAAAQATYDSLNGSEGISELVKEESEIFGRKAVLAGAVSSAMAPHSVAMEAYYFEEDGVLYEVSLAYCKDVADEVLADIAALTLE